MIVGFSHQKKRNGGYVSGKPCLVAGTIVHYPFQRRYCRIGGVQPDFMVVNISLMINLSGKSILLLSAALFALLGLFTPLITAAPQASSTSAPWLDPNSTEGQKILQTTPTETSSSTPSTTPSASASASATATNTSDHTATSTSTSTPSYTPSITFTPSNTPTPSPSLPPTKTLTPSRTPFDTPKTPTLTPSETLSPTASTTPTPTETITPTATLGDAPTLIYTLESNEETTNTITPEPEVMTLPSITPDVFRRTVANLVESYNLLRLGLVIVVVAVWGLIAVGLYIYLANRFA